jgi:hypothetical protein
MHVTMMAVHPFITQLATVIWIVLNFSSRMDPMSLLKTKILGLLFALRLSLDNTIA